MKPEAPARVETAEIIREYGPYPGADEVHGVTYDGRLIWFGSNKLNAISASTGAWERAIDVPCSAGTAFDGRYLYQISGALIQKIDPQTGQIVSTLAAPAGNNSGLAWAEGSLWVGQYRERTILEIDPETGAVLRTLRSDRFVTGVSWVDGELWHGTWEEDRSELRRIDPNTGSVQRTLHMPEGTMVSGLEAYGKDAFICGGGATGKLRAVRRR